MGDIAQSTETISQEQAIPAPRPRGFLPGHPRYGGRKKGMHIKRSLEAKEIAEQMGFHVVTFLVRAANEGVMLNPDGTETVLDAAMRLDAGKAVAPYLTPKLIAQTISGPNEGPIELARANTELDRAMAAPGGVEIIQRAALLIAGQPDAIGPPIGTLEEPISANMPNTAQPLE